MDFITDPFNSRERLTSNIFHTSSCQELVNTLVTVFNSFQLNDYEQASLKHT